MRKFKAKNISSIIIVSILVVSSFSLGRMSNTEKINVSQPKFIAIDRALGDNAGDETLRSCGTRKAKELLSKSGANSKSGAIDYHKLLDYIATSSQRDLTFDTGVLTRGTIPFQIMQQCRELTVRPNMAVGDLDGNGLPEIAIVRNDGIVIHWNEGMGRFSSDKETLFNVISSGPISFVDANGDGKLDVVSFDMINKIITTIYNTGERSFSLEHDIVSQEGFDPIGGDANWTIKNADLNLDGLSDLVITNRSIGSQITLAEETGDIIRPIRIFYNQGGNGNWREETLQALPKLVALSASSKRSAVGTTTGTVVSGSFDVAISDYNNDSWPDIYVASDFTVPRMFFAKPGGKSFIDMTAKSNVIDDRPNTMGAASIDWDNDGWYDIIATDTDRKLSECFGNRACAGNGGHRLLRNNKDGSFTDIGKEIGISDAGWGYGFTLTDLNLDGYGDFLVATGDLPKSRNEEIWQTTFQKPFLNLRTDKGFIDGSGDLLRKLRAPGTVYVVASADFDGDLKPDLLFNGFESTAPYLLLNRTQGNAATIMIEGLGLNATSTGAEGARVTIDIPNRPKQNYVWGTLMSTFLVSTSKTAFPIGLGLAKKANITVTFPTGEVIRRSIQAGNSYIIKEQGLGLDK